MHGGSKATHSALVHGCQRICATTLARFRSGQRQKTADLACTDGGVNKSPISAAT